MRPAQPRDPEQAMGHTTVQPTRRPFIFTTSVLTIVALTVVILSLVVAARMPAPYRIILPPQSFLPGSPFPEDASCPHRRCCTTTPLSTWNFRVVCPIDHEGTSLYVTYDDIRQKIVQTAISAQDYTIGELISAWGTPTGIAQYGRAIDVYWGTRYAALFTCSFEPNSPVKFIIYDLEQHWATVWRGFASNKSGECLGFVKT